MPDPCNPTPQIKSPIEGKVKVVKTVSMSPVGGFNPRAPSVYFGKGETHTLTRPGFFLLSKMNAVKKLPAVVVIYSP